MHFAEVRNEDIERSNNVRLIISNYNHSKILNKNHYLNLNKNHLRCSRTFIKKSEK